MPELSIIVPVYNAEKYLEKCLDSIINQTFRDYETILIDDGSTDRSGIICDEYAVKDARFKVIHQKNSGVSSARNTGLDIAQGKYLGFIDADDWVDPNMYKAMISKTKTNYKADIVICGASVFNEDNGDVATLFCGDKTYNKEQMLNELLGLKPNHLGGSNCNKIFKNKNKLYETSLVIGEDIVYLFDNIMEAEEGIQIEDVLYHVTGHHSSATRKNSIDTMEQLLGAYKIIVDRSQNCEEYIRNKATNKYIDTCERYINMALMEDKKISTSAKERVRQRMIHLLIKQRFSLKQMYKALRLIL